MTWSDILSRWQFVTADLQERGVDVWDRDLMRSRPWPWLRAHILGLLSADTRLHRALAPQPEVPELPQR